VYDASQGAGEELNQIEMLDTVAKT